MSSHSEPLPHLHQVFSRQREQRDGLHGRAVRQVPHSVGVEKLQHALEGGAVGRRDVDGAGLRAAATLAHASHTKHGVEVLAAGRQDGSVRSDGLSIHQEGHVGQGAVVQQAAELLRV